MTKPPLRSLVSALWLGVLLPFAAAAQESGFSAFDQPSFLAPVLGLETSRQGAAGAASDLGRLLPPAQGGAAELAEALRGSGGIDPQVVDEGLGRWVRGDANISAQTLIDAGGRLDDTAGGNLSRGLVTELVEGNFGAAAEFYQQAADQGDADAAVLFGRARLYGAGGLRDVDVGQKYLEKALAAQNPAVRATAALEFANAYRIGVLDDPSGKKVEEYLTLAATADKEKIPLLIDFLVNDRALDPTGPEITAQIAAAADAGNASALYRVWQLGPTDEARATALDQLLQAPDRIAGRYVGDIELGQGNVRQAFEAYRRAADVDPYALAQSGILALENPAMNLGVTQQQAMDSLRGAADLGAPNAYVALAQRSTNPDQQYLFALNGMANDPQGLYREELNNILDANCAADEERCRPTPVWYITNRVPNRADGGYSNQIDEVLHVGVTNTVVRTELPPDGSARSWFGLILCAVSLTDCTLGDTLSVSRPETAPQNSAPADFLSELKNAAAQKDIHDVVVFIHGFNNTFDVAAQRLALLINRGEVKAVPVLLSWASGAETLVHNNSGSSLQLAYFHDRTMADKSCANFLSVLRKLAEIFGPDHVQIVAHSMGGQLLDMMADGCGDPAYALGRYGLSNVVLAAPDIDAATFADHYSSFRVISEHLTLYVSANDVALKVSSDIMNPGRKRLGTGGNGRFVQPDAMTVDSTRLEAADEADWINHKNVFDVPEARRDLGLLLNGNYSDGQPRCLERIARGQSGFFLTRNGC